MSPRSYFAFTPLLNSTASGTLEFRTAIEPVRNKRRPHIDFIQGWADDINLTNKTVVIEENLFEEGHHATVAGDGRDGHAQADKVKVSQEDARKKGELLTVPYDKLIVAVGCYNNTFGTKGVKEHALFLKDITGARALRNRILECFEVASLPTTHAEVKKQLLHFAIVGGGPTGMEFAAELSDLIRQDLIHLYPSVKDFIRVTVYDVAERVLSMFDQQLVDFAMKTYKREVRSHCSLDDARYANILIGYQDQDQSSRRRVAARTSNTNHAEVWRHCWRSSRLYAEDERRWRDRNRSMPLEHRQYDEPFCSKTARRRFTTEGSCSRSIHARRQDELANCEASKIRSSPGRFSSAPTA